MMRVKAQDRHITIVYVLWHWQKPENKQRGWQIPPNMDEEFAGTIYHK